MKTFFRSVRLRATNFFVLKARLLSLYGGVFIVTLWTFLRHITNGVNFDIVGQIGLADQWSRGLHGGVVLGQTNYLFKIPLYALVNTFHFISPLNRLLLLAITFNIVTYILLFLLAEKMCKLCKIKDRQILYISMLWLATIAGSVFWLDYANSRNLETVGGIAIIYLTAKYLVQPNTKLAATLVAISSLVFFADSLQFFVCGLGACLYVFYRWLIARNHRNFVQMAVITASIIAGYIGSKLLFLASTNLLPVSYLAIPNVHPALTFTTMGQSLRGISASFFTIFDADVLHQPSGPNSVRKLLNLVVLVCLSAYVIGKCRVKNKQKNHIGILISVVASNVLVYVASGQALQPNTARYFIMLPIVAVTFVPLYGPKMSKQLQAHLQQAWLGIIAVSVLLLIGALVTSWPQRHSKDQHIYQTLSYLQKNKFEYALGSHELGVTTTYFASGDAVVLPISCAADHSVHVINLFYDKAAFRLLRDYRNEVPIILSDSGNKTTANHCDKTGITTAFGKPKREQIIPGVGYAQIYDASQISISSSSLP